MISLSSAQAVLAQDPANCGIEHIVEGKGKVCDLDGTTLLNAGQYTLCTPSIFCCQTGTACPAITVEDGEVKPTLNIFDGPTAETMKFLNPLNMFNSPYAEQFSSPAGIINRALRFAFPLAGLILFVMIVWGGFEILSGASSKKSLDQARQRIFSAVIGFGLLFVSFWIIQIVEYIFNLAIL
jgi:hypothetical protein